MTYTPSISEETHVLVQIELTNKTLYFADEHLSMSDGNFYEGRVEVSSIVKSFSSFTEPKQRQSTLTVRIKDTDSTVRQYLDTYTWGNRTVKVLVGKGRNISDYTEDFRGIIKFPGGVSYGLKTITMKLRDARNKEWLMLPINKFWTSTYSNLEDGYSGRSIPIIYGDWSDTDVPAICIDTTTNQFKIADHAIQSIEQVYKNGSPVSHSNENLTDATFTISSYTPVTDQVTVTLKGKMDGSSNLIEHPVEILTDLQTDLIGIAAGDIDTDSYAVLEEEIGTVAARRYIGTELSSNTLIEELAIECDFDLFVSGGKYTAKSRMPGQTYSRHYDATNANIESFNVDYDPEGLYANRIRGYYNYDPVAESYADNGLVENEIEQTAVDKVISRTLHYNWLYDSADVSASLAHKILLYSKEIRVVSFEAKGDGILVELAERVGITMANLSNRPLMVRDMSKDLKRKISTISGYDVVSIAIPGYWMNDDAPDYASATLEERSASGFFTDDNGEASPGDSESAISMWW